MASVVELVDVWVAGVKDEPGGLGRVLSGLRDAGANLDFVVARRTPERPGTGVVFVSPLRTEEEMSAAAGLGFSIAGSVHSVRVEGKNASGIGAEISEKLGTNGISMRGMSASVSGDKFVVYIGLDSPEDATKALEILKG